MKRILVLLCALILCLTATTAQAKRSAYGSFDYKMCNKVGAILGHAQICLSTTATRQDDGTGFIIHDVRIYTDIPGQSNDCDSSFFEDDPAVMNYKTYILAYPGESVVTKWLATTPELQPSNGCYYKYTLADQPGQVVEVSSNRLSIRFDYKARMNNYNDQTEEIYLTLGINSVTQNQWWNCDTLSADGEIEICNRQLI